MTKRCPVCDSVLFRQRVSGAPPAVAIEGCAGCGGAWLADGSLGALTGTPDALRAAGKQIRATEVPLKPQRSDKCPADSSPLTPTEYPAFPGIRLLGCATCRGVFAEAGVLASLADRVAPAPAVPASPSAIPGAISVGGGSHGPAARVAPMAADIDGTSTNGLPLVRAVSMPPYSPPTGFFDRFSRGWTFISGAYRLAFEKPVLLAPIAVGFGVSLVYWAFALGTLFGVYMLSGGPAADHAGGAWAKAHGILLAIFGAVFGTGGYVINFFFTGMTISMIDAWLKGREPSLGTAARDVMKNIAGIVQLALVTMLVSIIIGFVRGNQRSRGLGGMVLDGVRSAIAKMIEEAWTVLTYLLLPVIMIEDVALRDALGRVRDIHRGNIMQIAVGEIGIHLVARLIGFVVMLAFIPMALVLLPMGIGGIVAWVGSLIFVLMIIGLLNAFVRAAYYTCLYLWAVELERNGAQARVPAPLAAAFR